MADRYDEVTTQIDKGPSCELQYEVPVVKTIRESVTARSLFIGALLTFFLSVGDPYGNMAIRGSYMAIDFSTAGALFLFFCLVGGLNVILRVTERRLWAAGLFLAVIGLPYIYRVSGHPDFTTPGMIFASSVFVIALVQFGAVTFRRSLTLDTGELLVVYVMMICASAISSMGLSEYLLPIITAPFYYASPENDWAHLIHPHLPRWAVPQDPEATRGFYEGLPRGMPIPWKVWGEPLFYWGIFLAALYFVMICLMVVLRRQWMERERLIYPLVQVPLEMVQEGRSSDLLRPFFKRPAMWIGFAIPVIVSSLNAFHAYYSVVPGIALTGNLEVFRRTLSLPIRLSFVMVGFSYLINLDIALSLWLFNILANLQKGVFNVLGIVSTEKLGIYGAASSPYLAHQGMGAMIVLVLFGLWIGREHIKQVILKAIGKAPEVDDSDEILSYRTAVFGIVGGLLVMWIWLWQSGLALWAGALFLFGALLIFVGLARIVVEAGVAEAVASTISSSFVVSGVGSSVLGPSGLIALALTYVWAADIRTYLMVSCVHSLKLTEYIKGNRRALFWTIVFAVVIALVGSIWMIMKLSYGDGGINLNGWFFGHGGGAMVPYTYINEKLLSPTSPDIEGWVYTGIGAGVMILLMLARQHFLWWPLHPVGFPIGCVWIMDNIWFSIFLAWLFKAVILKYGGPKLYRNLRPFFLGLILGQFVIAGVWLVIDYFTGMTDNVVFWI
ncbi:MAG: hypothetical protein HY709_08405 [Candidatus Latescibacteria bacterium]|nr:hypothetical protein [Candidatus Latescibacterota bacterium]